MSINAVSSHLHRHSWSLLWTLGVLAVVILGFSPRSIAQTDTGRIVGTVTDSGGAAISGAIITVTNQENNAKFTATADASVLYGWVGPTERS